MATFLLIRHAAHADVGQRLSGRLPGLALTPAGRAQASATAARLSHEPLAAVHASPLERATETAAAIVGPHGLPVVVDEALTEIDFGDWTGRDFADLDGDLAWDAWNTRRSAGQAPNGERMADAQGRIVACLEGLADSAPAGPVAIVTHCDLIRAAVCHLLGLSLDHILRFEVSPASITRVTLDKGGGCVLSLNEGGIA